MTLLTVPKGSNAKTSLHNSLIRLQSNLDGASKAVGQVLEFIDRIPNEKFHELLKE